MTRRMLLLEDDAILRKHLCRLLARHGFEVRAVSSVDAFLSWALRLEFQAFLLDLSLPDGDGLDAWGRARSVQPGAVAVLMTAHGSDEVARRAADLGIQALLPKPIDVPNLLAALGARSARA